MNDQQTYTLKQIWVMINRQDFADWYQREFDDYITGELNAPPEEECKTKLARMLK